MSSISDKFDLELAWERVKNDSSKVVFCERPYQIEVIDGNLSEWLDIVRSQLDAGYNPGDMQVINVPKPGNLVRKGNYLSLSDRLVYNACVGALQEDIFGELSWAQGSKDYSYQLSENHHLSEWFDKSPYECWKQFGIESVDAAKQHNFVLITDIASYYDGIHVRTLMSMLNTCGVDRDVQKLLSSCLSHWSSIHGRGIPQGLSASHILAKLYLNGLDQKLSNRGYTHKCYNDDIRVFCDSRDEARNAIVDIVETLRANLGLNIQSAKTEINPARDTVADLKRITDIVESIQEEVRIKSTVVIQGGIQYDDIVLSLPDEDISKQAIRDAVDEYLLGDHPFDKTLFHYLIHRLDDKRAIPYCMSLIKNRPQETRYCLDYIEKVDEIESQDDMLAMFIRGSSCIHDYQIYQILMWRSDNPDVTPSDELVRTVRDIVFNGKSIQDVLIGAAYRFLSVFGNLADLDDLKALSPQLNKEGKCEIVCSIGRMEKSKRNGFFGTLKGEAEMIDWSIDWVKQRH